MSCIVEIRCRDCDWKWDHDKETVMANSPEGVICPNCGSINTHRIFSVSAIDSAEGKHGNAKTGYSTGFVYHPSSLAPNMKGTRIKTIK
jgi:ribosomal protein S27E